MKFTSVLALVAGTALAAQKYDRTVETAEGRIVHSDHDVGLGVDDDLCIFKNGWDQWCFSTITPMARLGIEWEQTYDTTDRNVTPVLEYYQMEFKPYVDSQIYVKMTFHIEKVTIIELLFDIPSFITSLIGSFSINSQWSACGGAGYESERIYAYWKLKLRFYNCSKALIDNVFDWSSNWTGNDALALEDCDYNDGNWIGLWEQALLEDTIDPIAFAGTFNPTSALCTTALTSASPYFPVHVRKFLQSSIKTLADYGLGEQSPLKNAIIE